MRPVNVTKQNEGALILQQYGQATNQTKIKSFKFDVGDRVRISYLRTTFMREYHEKWTTEIFTVMNRRMREEIPVYKVDEHGGEDVCEDELQLVNMPEVVKGKSQHLVR